MPIEIRMPEFSAELTEADLIDWLVKPGDTVAEGDLKEILFRMIHTVHVTVKMVASESGIWFRQNYELWQDGEEKYRVHATNGARVLPGT